MIFFLSFKIFFLWEFHTLYVYHAYLPPLTLPTSIFIPYPPILWAHFKINKWTNKNKQMPPILLVLDICSWVLKIHTGVCSTYLGPHIQRKRTLSSPNTYQLPIAPQLVVGLHAYLSFPCWSFVWLELARISCMLSHCREFTGVPRLLCLENTVSS